MASATRYATSAESIPPDRPSTSAVEAGLPQLAADELADDPPRDVGVDGQLGRELEGRPAPHVDDGRLVARGSRSDAASGRPGATSDAGLGARARWSCRAPCPARSAMIRASSRTWSSGRSSRSSGRAIRSRRMSAGRMSTREQALVVERRAEQTAAPVGAMTSEPPQNEIDSSTPTRLQNTTNDVVSWAYVRISVRHEVAVPSPTSFVAARSRPGDDDTLMRIWAPSSASSWGTDRCQKSSHTPIPMPTPEPRRHGPQQVAGGEEAPLVEQPVGRQEELAMDVADLARPRAAPPR